jgi:hypothetical protein
VITVGATDSQDRRADFSDFGSCVSVFAPGDQITSVGIPPSPPAKVMSGTSMATPHVTGTAALYLQEAWNATPAQVKRWIIDSATPNALSDIGTGSPNLLAYAPAVFGSSIGLSRNGDGRLEAVGTNSDDGVFLRWQQSPGNNAWANWFQFDTTSPRRSVATEADANGRLEIFGVNAAGHVFYANQLNSANAWAGWGLLPGQLNTIAAARNADGRIELFGTNNSNQIWHMVQTSPGNWVGANWQAFDGGLIEVAAETNADGRVELFGTNINGDAFHRVQTRPGDWTGSSWAGITLPGGSDMLTSIAAARNADGRLQLVATDAPGRVWVATQVTPGGSAISSWGSLDGQLTQVAAETNADGRVEILGVNEVGAVFHRSQVTPGGGWTAWSVLDGQLRS